MANKTATTVKLFRKLTTACEQSASAHENSSSQSWDMLTTAAPSDGGAGLQPAQIALCVFQFSIVLVCALANILVLISFANEKKLRTTFSILIANLALTDFIVAIIPMNFYTINTTLGYWPLGKVLCGLWVVVDYNTVFASTYTLMAISIDRLWSVKWGILYRQHNTKRKAVTVVALIWSYIVCCCNG
jgi:presenilin-like A22 family membrane protease